MAVYSKSEYKKLEKRFEGEWSAKVLAGIAYLKDFVGTENESKLDFSADSIKYMSQLIINNFDDPYNFGITTGKDLLDAISIYIGEAYIKNSRGLAVWHAYVGKPVDGQYYFEAYILFSGGLGGDYSPHHYPYTIYNKSFDNLYNVFNAKIESCVENYKSFIPIPGRGGYAYQYFILLKDENFTLQIVEETIQNYNLKFSKGFELSYYNDKHLLVKMSDDYYFHFSFDDSAGLDEESQSIASKYQGEKDKSAIASCKTRIEFWGDEDPNGDFINNHMSLLDLFISNEDIFIYDFRNGMFYDEF